MFVSFWPPPPLITLDSRSDAYCHALSSRLYPLGEISENARLPSQRSMNDIAGASGNPPGLAKPQVTASILAAVLYSTPYRWSKCVLFVCLYFEESHPNGA